MSTALPLMRRRGPGNQPLIDGIAHGGIGRAGAFRAHVALGGEAGHQVVAGGQHGEDGALRNGFLNGLQVLRAGMQEQVHMRVDQAGQQRAIAQVDDLRAGRMGDRGAGFDDAVVLHQHLTGRKIAPGFDIQHARRVQHDGVFRRGGDGTAKENSNAKVLEHGLCARS